MGTASSVNVCVAPDDLVELGRIVAAYGVKGWIKIKPYSARAEGLLYTVPTTHPPAATPVSSPLSVSSHEVTPPAVLSSAAPVWWLKQGLSALTAAATVTAYAPYVVSAVRPQGVHIVAHLAGIDSRDQACQLRGQGVYVSRQHFPPLVQDEYYWVDLIGCQVFGTHHGQRILLGEVDEVLDYGAHALLKVTRPVQVDVKAPCNTLKTSRNKVRYVEILVPFVRAHITDVDLANRCIESNWPLEF